MKLKSRAVIPAAVVLLTCTLSPLAYVQTAQAQAPDGGVTTVANEESKTGYTTTFTYADSKATNVQILGGFQFYVRNDPKVYANGFALAAGDPVTDYYYTPDQWENDLDLCHVNDVGYVEDMVLDKESGEWSIRFDLPCASYLYQYNVSYDGGETYEAIMDPCNTAPCNEYGANQNRSQFYVPYDSEKQSETDDWSWLMPVEDEAAKGEIVYTTYPGFGDTQRPVEIYLPAGYDAKRESPYKILYLTHGGGGEQGDWFYQGNAANIIDRLVSEEKCGEFVVVCMNNADFLIDGTRDWDFDAIFENVKNFLMPYMEENYNISEEVSERAFAGLSNGAKATTIIYYKDPELFGYYGMFSGSAAWAWPKLEDYSSMKKPNLYLAAGFADHLMMQNTYHTDQDKTLVGFKELLDSAEITYNSGGEYVTVQGAHDWFTWPQILKDYLETTLFK